MKLFYQLLATKRQKHLLRQIPQIISWHEHEYFWKTLATEWQRGLAGMIMFVAYVVMGLFLAGCFGVLNLLAAALS